MAARAGATLVTSCEMVPALAEAASSISKANGYGGVVRVLARKSTDARASERDDTTLAQLANARRDATSSLE